MTTPVRPGVGLYVQLSILIGAVLGGRLMATQFPGQTDAVKRSSNIVDRERAERATLEPSEEDTRIRILVPGKDDRVQLDRWTYAREVSGIDPLTQIVRMFGGSSTGSGFLLPDCRVMTNLHVVAGMKKGNPTWKPGESAVGDEYEYETLPLPWLDNARAYSTVVFLGHGQEYVSSGRLLTADSKPDEDWAIGYDLGCASQRYRLGILHLDEAVKDPLELWRLRTFAAGFSGVTMRGLSPYEWPLYIDTRCRVLARSHYRRATSHYEMNCSLAPGGSGQPFLSGLMTDPVNPNLFRSEGGRPRLVALGMFDSGGGRNESVPNFATRSNAIVFDEPMRRRFRPYLEGLVDIATLRYGSARRDQPRLLLSLRPRYTEDARRRRVEGRITLDFTVRADGSVEHVALVSGLDGGLDELALTAARLWFFAPALRNGVPVTGRATLSLPMRLPPE